MTPRLIALICLLGFIQNLKAQQKDLNDFLNDNFFSHDIDHAEIPKFVEGKESSMILDYSERNSKFYDKSKVNNEKIKNVHVTFHTNDSLVQVIRELQKFPNLEFLEIETKVFFRKDEQRPQLLLPTEILQFEHLRFLQISGKFKIDYGEFIELVRQFPNLRYLGFSHVEGPIHIPESIKELKTLEGLKILGFKNIRFPEVVGELSNLTTLFLEPYESMEKVNLSSISNFPNIKRLGLYYANLDLDNLETISQLYQLETFMLVNSKVDKPEELIKFLPSGIKDLKLRNLKSGPGNISFEKFSEIENIELQTNISYQLESFDYKLENLKSLTIHSDSLKKIKVGSLTNLKLLNLSYSNLTGFPEGIKKLKQLKEVYLSENKISEIPGEISGLRNLRILELDKNRVKKIEKGLGKLDSLEKLNLAYNHLESLPEDFTRLENLKDLNLNANNLKTLPMDFGSLKSLISLNLGDNYLDSLPESITQLTHLKDLDVSHNNIKKLPENIGDMIALQDLILGGNKGQEINFYSIQGNRNFNKNRKREFNQISRLPESFKKLKNIKRLYFKNLNTLDSENLFQTLFHLPSERYRTEVSGTGINSLPIIGWENYLGETLEMGNCVVGSIPRQILDAPYLEQISFKLNEADGLSYHFNSRNEFLAFAEDSGFIEFEDIERSEIMAKAYLEYANRKTYQKDKDNILAIYKKAFVLDSIYTASHIREADFAKALANNKEYKKAITYYDKAVQKDTLRGPYILNFIIPHFRERAEVQLKVGDSLGALKSLEYLSGRFDKSSWSSTALLAKRMNKDSLAKRYFNKAVEYYEKKINYSKENNRVNFLEQLSLLELFYMKEDFELASNYLSELKELEFKSNDELVLRRFFGMIDSIVNDSADRNLLISFNEYLYSHETTLRGWSFELFENWLGLTESISKEKKSLIYSALGGL